MSEPDVVARVLGVAGISVATASIFVTVALWWKAGPRLRVKLSLDEQGERLIIEASNVGRMPAVVRRLGIRDVIVVQGSTNQTTTTLLSLECQPADGTTLPHTLSPTDWLTAAIPLESVSRRWDPGKRMRFVAWAEKGDGRKAESQSLKVTTPHPRSDA